MKVFLSVLFGAVMFSSSASAAIFSYITKSTVIGPGQADYDFVIERWDDYDPSVLNECTYRPCYLAINHKHTAAGTPGISTHVAVEVTNLRTMQEVRQAFLRQFSLPFSGMTRHRGDVLQSNQECVGLFFQNNRSGGTGYLLSGSLCGIAPPPVGACKINENIPNISFGSISEGELAGQSREVAVSVSCNLAMNVLVIATGGSGTNSRENLRQDGSLYASLTLGNNNTPGENGYQLSIPANGVNTVTLKATLGTNGRVQPGAFNGAAALILTVP
ncbi:hypothetical protein MASR2M36_00630 [Providencia sp.]